MFFSLLHSFSETKKRIFFNTNAYNDCVMSVATHLPEKKPVISLSPPFEETIWPKVRQLRFFHLVNDLQCLSLHLFVAAEGSLIYHYCVGKGTI